MRSRVTAWSWPASRLRSIFRCRTGAATTSRSRLRSTALAPRPSRRARNNRRWRPARRAIATGRKRYRPTQSSRRHISETAPQGARYVFDADVPFGLPFRPTPFTATFTMSVLDTPFTITRPIQARSERDIFSGEKRSEIHVVPSFAVSTTPEVLVVSTAVTGTGKRTCG